MEHLSLMNALSVLLIALISISIYYIINIGNKYVKPSNMIVLTRNNIIKTAFIIVAMAAIFLVIRAFPIIPTTAITVFISIVVAYIINPMVFYFEGKGLKRLVAIAIVYVIIFGIITILLGIIIPKTVNEFRNLLIALPEIIKSTQKYLTDFSEVMFKDNQILSDMMVNLSENFEQILTKMQTGFFGWLSGIAQRVPNYFSNIIRIVLVPVVAFYLLLDKETLVRKIKEEIPETHKPGVFSLLRDIDSTLSEFVRGRLIMAVFVGAATGIFLMILGVDFAIVLGIVTTIADIVPYIGPFIGFLPAVVLALIQSPLKAVWVAVVFVLLQWIENNILGPKILGESIGLHPLVVLLSLIVGGGMAGVAGMIFAVPIVATLKVLYAHLGPSIKAMVSSILRD